MKPHMKFYTDKEIIRIPSRTKPGQFETIKNRNGFMKLLGALAAGIIIIGLTSLFIVGVATLIVMMIRYMVGN